MTPHGTPTGYTLGCRGGTCDNHRTALMTCTEAHTRYMGDYSYRLAVDNGTATAEKYAAPKLKPRIIRETPKAAKKRATRIVAVKVHAPKPLGRIPAPFVHGTKRMAEKGCSTNCPNEGLESGTCREARNRFERERYAQRKAAGTLSARGAPKNPKWVHGTIIGAVRGCTDYPESPSCLEVRRAYQNERNARRRVA
ncbi:hypothetical protein [Cryobacterium sp. Hh11]|uniref:hypothetical protein n=1 Tax=Cryobacterium sp. Hh11 TaxID=2555868 RepID=UPI00141B083B|nr:hypothetical protein [Cryobacterium sp. Hh11]